MAGGIAGRGALAALIVAVAAVTAVAVGVTPAAVASAVDEALLSRGRPATASSVETAAFPAVYAVDGNPRTRWSSRSGSDPQWLRVDLGAQRTVTRVVLRWEAAYARAYRIETSVDGLTWTAVHRTTAGDGGTDEVSGLAVTARHVRVYATVRATRRGYSLWELEVFGTVPGVTASPSPSSSPSPGPSSSPSSSASPAAVNGQLRVCGVNLCNAAGRAIQLRGMSTHGIQWYPQCVNAASLDALATDWGADVLRVSMYVQEGGYATDPQLFTQRVDDYVEQATARGLYVIVDWHMLTPGDPNANLARAKTFFAAVAQRHAAKTNVLYEIANEPNGVSWAAVKSYAEQVIPVIRAADPDAVVLVGTRGWSSLGVSDGASEAEVVANPVAASNLMYTFHFYAASHGQAYLSALSRAADRLPVFVTEFGTQQASGDGPNDFARAQAYLDLMAARKISWTNWNFSDDFRSGAVFTTGTCAAGGPYAGTARLKPAGVWVRDRIRTPDAW
jgi:endoglucanase